RHSAREGRAPAPRHRRPVQRPAARHHDRRGSGGGRPLLLPRRLGHRRHPAGRPGPRAGPGGRVLTDAPRFVAIHGHFYQPPRENPWLEVVEIQDSAYPYHDWNSRVTAECYGPNTAARRVDAENRIIDITNNFERISFNVGPTLLAWLAAERPDVYTRLLQADAASVAARGGHGNAIAQPYNHVILPLACRRDKTTQVRW